MADPSTTRRGFLKAATAAVPAAALRELAMAAGAYAAGSDVIRVGLIGCGGRGTGAAMNAMKADPGVRLVALCDIAPERIRIRRRGLQKFRPDQVAVDDAHCFADLGGYRKVIESVDVVLIAVASKFHAAYAKAAIEAGKHVFVEKPHAIDPHGVRDLVAARDLAKRKKLCLASGLWSRYDAGYRETVQRVRDGAIGDIVAIEESLLRGPYVPYRRVEGLTETQHQFRNWASFAWLSGDDLLQGLLHNLDRDNWAMGDRAPIKCHGLGGRSSAPAEFRGTLFDHHAVIYEYADGVRLYAFCRAQRGCYAKSSTVILGTKGRCLLMERRIEGEATWRYRRPRGRSLSPYDAEQQALFKAIRSADPLNEGDLMIHSAMAGVMGQLACYTGREVTWARAMESDFVLGPKPLECSFDMAPPVTPDANGIYPVPIPGRTTML